MKYFKDNSKYWFKAKSYGWGWVPVTWQGWLITLVYVGVIITPGILLEDGVRNTEQFLTLFFPLVIVATAILMWVCFKKGERPRWSWGNTKRKD